MDSTREFRGRLLAVAQKLRDQSARTWTADPVRAKTLERIRDYVEVLLSSPNLTDEKKVEARAIWLESLEKLDDVPRETAFPREIAFEIEADLRASLLELMGDDYIYMCLQSEKQRLAPGRSDRASGHIWIKHFPENELDKLLEDFDRNDGKFKEPARPAAIRRLVERYKQSHHDLWRDRARAAQAAMYLTKLSPALLLLLITVMVLPGFAWAEGRWAKFVAELVALGIAICAGGLRGVLGLMFRFRDARGRIRELLSDRDLRWVQPLIGAAMALVVILVVKSGLITIAGVKADGANLAQLAVVGFVAGFSEPVFLGVIDRLVRVTSEGSSDGGRS